MNLEKLLAIKGLAALQFENAQSKIKGIMDEEQRLRAQLAKLDRHAAVVLMHEPEQGTMRALGADIAWLHWLDRSRTSLNTRLAQVLARKEQYMAELRRLRGRKEVAQKLVDETSRSNRKKAAKRLLDDAVQRVVRF